MDWFKNVGPSIDLHTNSQVTKPKVSFDWHAILLIIFSLIIIGLLVILAIFVIIPLVKKHFFANRVGGESKQQAVDDSSTELIPVTDKNE